MSQHSQTSSLQLTEEEALELLHLVMISPTVLSPVQRTAIEKLSDYCRHLLRRQEETDTAHEPRPPNSVKHLKRFFI